MPKRPPIDEDSSKTVEVDDVTWLAPYVLRHRVSSGEETPDSIVTAAIKHALAR